MAYDSPYGTGNRTASITVTADINFHANPVLGGVNMFVNGNKTETQMWSADVVANKYLRFLCSEAIIVDHLKWYQQNTSNHGVFKVQGSNDGTNWTNIGSSFTLGGATAQEIDISANTIAYSYYQFLGVSGSMSSSPWIYEVEFSWTYPVSSGVVACIGVKDVDGIVMIGIENIV